MDPGVTTVRPSHQPVDGGVGCCTILIGAKIIGVIEILFLCVMIAFIVVSFMNLSIIYGIVFCVATLIGIICLVYMFKGIRLRQGRMLMPFIVWKWITAILTIIDVIIVRAVVIPLINKESQSYYGSAAIWDVLRGAVIFNIVLFGSYALFSIIGAVICTIARRSLLNCAASASPTVISTGYAAPAGPYVVHEGYGQPQLPPGCAAGPPSTGTGYEQPVSYGHPEPAAPQKVERFF